MSPGHHRKVPTEWWAETLEHISKTWQRKKGKPYFFTGPDLRLLKSIRSWLTAAELLSLWDLYLKKSPYWGSKTGFSITGFFTEKTVLIDDPEFKKLTAKYEADFGLKTPKEIALELGI